MLLNKILVANRGEIACRIIRTCQDMGIATVAVYSRADKNAQHVQIADEAIYLGESPAASSYLNIESVIGAAIRSSADAIHPGYGFLAENPNLAYAAITEGITFIGPPPSAMEVMGNKRAAKLILQDVPYVPGYFESDQSDETFIAEAEKIGFPIMIKAVAGGGGKGMRLVEHEDDMIDALATCRREAKQAFTDDNLMLEKVVVFPRHIEIQIFGDHVGNVIALGERECSIQRRYQKIIEESPSAMMTPELRLRMCETAVKIGQQTGYYGAGTVEFLVDDDLNYYFMEMNARLQVEHPVTEIVTGFDLVRWQIEIARGVTLDELLPEGVTTDSYRFDPRIHAIEARVYAEDPSNDFLPQIGQVIRWESPDFVRTDTGIQSGDEITTFYDPMVAKVIAHGTSRLEAIRRLDYGLSKVQLFGVKNNIGFLRRVLTHADHLAGIIHTGWLNEYPELVESNEELSPIALIALAFAKQSTAQHWRNNPNLPIEHSFVYNKTEHRVQLQPTTIEGQHLAQIGTVSYEVDLVNHSDNELILVVDGYRQYVYTVEAENDQWWVHDNSGSFVVMWQSPFATERLQQNSEGSLLAPMPGVVVQVVVENGQEVEQGEILMILEAMKMEHQIIAPVDGIVAELFYEAGDSVQQDAVLLELHQHSE